MQSFLVPRGSVKTPFYHPLQITAMLGMCVTKPIVSVIFGDCQCVHFSFVTFDLFCVQLALAMG